MSSTLMPIFLALMAGCLIPVQAGINSQLGRVIGHPLLASMVSFLVGTGGLLVLCFAMGVKLPTMQQVQSAPPWMWIGGFMGAFFVTGSVLLAPRLGAANMIGLIVCGQLFSAILLDHFGYIGYVMHPVSPGRIIGAVLLLAGMFLIQRF